MSEHVRYEPCEECGAPLDPQQRYCVNCAARRPSGGANPSSRYFATMSKRAHRPPPRPPVKGGSNSRAAAVAFFALLPIAVAIGVVVGRSGSDGGENEALLEALRKRPAATAAASAGTTTAAANAKVKKGKTTKKASKGGGKVVAHTSNGTVHQVAGYKAPQKTVEEDTRLVEDNPEQTGDNYIKAQQHLPDVIVVGGEGGSAPSSSAGAGEP
jgi:hypothetical protein